MRRNQQGIYNNQLSSHASLLLSASPTIINSPLQNNTNNNPQTPPVTPSSVGIARRQPNAPLLVSASNLDHNDSHINTDSPSNNSNQEGYINFKKPQNEMFKKLDGKIQKIVAAHSNLNKLYALNDFSSLGPGPKRPFELPPQLPPPPPWIPKVAAEYVNQWNDESMSPLNVLNEPTNLDVTDFSPGSNLFGPNSNIIKTLNNLKPSTNLLATTTATKGSSLTIDSAITKLHQRRQQQQQQQIPQSRLSQQVDLVGPIPCSSSSTNSPPPVITSAQFSLLAQKIKETLETECSSRAQGGNLLDEDKRKLREDLIALLKDEISAVTKSTKFRFSTPVKQNQPRTMEQKSLLLKSSPQTLYNTIHRETSLLLNKRDQSVRSNLSLLPDNQTFSRQNAQHELMTSASNRDRGNRMMIQTIKVIVPPTEFHQTSSSKPESKESSENLNNRCSESSDSQQNSFSRNHTLTYQVIRNKIRSFQETNQIYLGKSHKFAHGLIGSSPGFKKRKSPQKTLDRIVDRLQAKWSPSPTEVDRVSMQGVQRSASLRQQIINSSASLLQSSRIAPTISAPTPIPVFRSPLSMAAKGGYYYATSGASKIVNSKSKKSKRLQCFGLKISNYLERECPQPTTEKITIEQFAKCLDLVRSNDISLQRRQEQLLQSESKWRMPIGNRPLRLRRIRGERIHMPASASYKATRKIGLQ